jgi:hypothetical protein
MSLEASDHLPARPDDPHVAIIAPKEQAIRAGAHASYLVAFEDIPCIVIAELDLAHVEEVERFPLEET